MHTKQVKIWYVRKKKLNLTIQWNRTKLFNSDYITKQDIKKYNENWSEFSDHPYRILIAGGSASGKTNALLNLINH